ncbi:MAG: hypothetical protein IT378_01900 [Sandaracinaceae bacterium]|nr:hypothetical protein [Sandaracinaceae bacterium]
MRAAAVMAWVLVGCQAASGPCHSSLDCGDGQTCRDGACVALVPVSDAAIEDDAGRAVELDAAGVDAASSRADAALTSDAGAGFEPDAGSGSDAGGAVGAACSDARPCAAGLECRTSLALGVTTREVPLPGGYCTRPCTPSADRECGASAICTLGWCTAACDALHPCRTSEGYACARGACLP